MIKILNIPIIFGSLFVYFLSATKNPQKIIEITERKVILQAVSTLIKDRRD